MESLSAAIARTPALTQPFASRALSVVLWVAFCGYAAFTVLSLFGATLGQFDDALPLLHGVLVQQGRTPNLDFYSFYPPLNAYVNAGVFALLGRSVLAARLVTASLYGIVLWIALRAFRAHLRSVPPVFVPATGLLLATSVGAAANLPMFPGLALSLAVLLVYLNAASRRSLVALSGFLAGITVLYRINFGGYAVAVICLDLLLNALHAPGRRFQENARRALIFLVPFSVTTTGICFWIYGSRSPQAVSEFVGTAQKLMALRGFITLQLTADVASAVALPAAWFLFRSLSQSRVLLPGIWSAALLAIFLPCFAIVAGGSVAVVLVLIAAEWISVLCLHLFVYPLPRSELIALLFYCGLLHYFISRADWFHWRVLPIGVALLLCFSAIETARSVHSRGIVFALVLASSFILFSTQALRPSASNAKSGAHLLARFIRRPHLNDTREVLDEAVPAAGWATVYPDRDELDALRFLRSHSSQADAIFVGVQDQSRVFWNDLLIYWLADRPIGVRTFQLETRVATEAPVQRQMIYDLQRNHVHWIVLDCAPDEGDETFVREAYRGSALLDQYIATSFVQTRRFGRYAVLTTRSP